jgi:hypothetical protein
MNGLRFYRWRARQRGIAGGESATLSALKISFRNRYPPKPEEVAKAIYFLHDASTM